MVENDTVMGNTVVITVGMGLKLSCRTTAGAVIMIRYYHGNGNDRWQNYRGNGNGTVAAHYDMDITVMLSEIATTLAMRHFKILT